MIKNKESVCAQTVHEENSVSSLTPEEEKLQTSSAAIPMMDVLCQQPCILICSKPDLTQCFTSKSQEFTDKKLTQGNRKAEVVGTD